MKLSITQVLLGIIVVIVACYLVGWMIYDSPVGEKHPVPNPDGTITYWDVTPIDAAKYYVARDSSFILPFIGILIVILGTFQAARGGGNVLWIAVVNIVSGALIAALALLITVWGFPTTFDVVPREGDDVLHRIFGNPGSTQIFVNSVAAGTVAPGLAVLGVGITQLVKSKKKAAA